MYMMRLAFKGGWWVPSTAAPTRAQRVRPRSRWIAWAWLGPDKTPTGSL